MQRRTLAVTQPAQFPRLVGEARVGRDRHLVRTTDAFGNLGNDERDVVEETVGGKDLPRADRKERQQSLEPSCGERPMLLLDAVGDEGCRTRC